MILKLLVAIIIIFSVYLYQNSFFNNSQMRISENPSKLITSPISILYLKEKSKEIDSPLYEEVSKVGRYKSYESFIVSFLSEGEKVFALLTIPSEEKPEGGFPAIIFNHGYIPPKNYSTTGNYASYVDYLASNGFIVMKIDMRGHGNSEGVAIGTYFGSSYTIDVISALKSLQKSEIVNHNRIGLWGHSMSGNLVLRSMLVESSFKAGVIWAGAVYSYQDFAKYRISDNSFQRPPVSQPQIQHKNRDASEEITKFREDSSKIDFSNDFWKAISLTENLNFLQSPIQIHHAVNDDVVNIGYSRDLVKKLEENNKKFEYFEYQNGGHNITGVSFLEAMQRSVEFFKKNL
jgi:dipeptidyl aminopeptidase/acylaminoacyl peptidase